MHDPIQVMEFAEIFFWKNISIQKNFLDKDALEKPFKHHKVLRLFYLHPRRNTKEFL